ncbi:MAG: PocR ligand-binding domain-containing protein [Clostridia bacterium]|nr:PocR ligand-binding domain-containing protein [Clostridia bacterium]
MEIVYDVDMLKTMLFDLAELTGITISVYDYEGNNLADCMHGSLFCLDVFRYMGKSRCAQCGQNLVEKCKKSLKYEETTCFMGLYEACMPIIIDDIWVGHVSLAGIRTESSFDTTILNDNESTDLFYTQPFYTQKQITALKNMLPKIIFHTAIKFVYDDRLDEITNFIKSNLKEKLTIELLCKKFNINKNSLYNIFKLNLDMTVNEYIITKRIEKAKLLIIKGVHGDKLIEEIGIENYSYFCRLFKSRTGKSPSDYRAYYGTNK